MRNSIIFIYNYILSKAREKKITHENIRGYLKDRTLISGARTQTAEEINLCISDLILSGKPFLAG